MALLYKTGGEKNLLDETSVPPHNRTAVMAYPLTKKCHPDFTRSAKNINTGVPIALFLFFSFPLFCFKYLVSIVCNLTTECISEHYSLQRTTYKSR